MFKNKMSKNKTCMQHFRINIVRQVYATLVRQVYVSNLYTTNYTLNGLIICDCLNPNVLQFKTSEVIKLYR
jgi:hypothetical protein